MTDLQSESVTSMTGSEELSDNIRSYLRQRGWSEQPPGPGGSLWRHDSAVVALPLVVFEGTTEWAGLVDRLVKHDRRSPDTVISAILWQNVDITRFRAADDGAISGSIPLNSGITLLNSAHTMLRAAATTSLGPRANIANYSVTGNKILASQTRLAHTERGSFVVPILVQLSEPKNEKSTTVPLPDKAFAARSLEAPERRLTRTLAQALQAVDQVVVQPERNATNAAIDELVMAGVSRQLLAAVRGVLTDSAVGTFSTEFQWATGFPAPSRTASRIEFSSSDDVVTRLEHAMDRLGSLKEEHTSVMTGPITGVQNRPDGEITIQTVRGGHTTRITVKVSDETARAAYGWANERRTIAVQGEVSTRRGRPPLVLHPEFVQPLDTIFDSTEPPPQESE